MYVPAHFRANDGRAFARELIAEYPFALLISVDGGEPLVTHVPCVLIERGDEWLIGGHVARANPQSEHVGGAATIVFTGAHGYISPSWYEPSPHNVPTWNYASVVCRGQLEGLNDDDTDALLRMLTQHHESRFENPWSVDEVGEDAYRQMRRAIVPFHLHVEHLDVKVKYSQNRSATDREGAITGLTALGGSDAALADAMRAV